MARQGGLERGIFLWPKGKDGKQYYGIRYADAFGKERKEKVGTSKSAAAAAYRARRVEVKKAREELARGKHPQRVAGAELTLSEAIDRFLEGAGAGKASAKGDRYHGALWLRAIGDPPLSDVLAEDVETWRNRWLGEGLAPGTVKHRLNFLGRVYNIAIRDELAARNPVSRVKVRKADESRVRYLTEDDEEPRLRDAFDERWWYVVEFAILTGLRQSEQFGLRWEQVDFRAEVLRIPKSKNGEARHVPMHPRVKEILQGLPSRMRSPWVFVGPRGGRLDPHNFCEDYFIPALERAGICKPRPKPLRRDRKHSAAAARPTKDPKAPRERREFTWHDLRHTMASRLVMAGRELYDVQRLLGHKDYKMTLRYAHLSPRHLRDAIRSISVAPAPQSENKPEKRQTAG